MVSKLRLYIGVILGSMYLISCSPRVMKNVDLENEIAYSIRIDKATLVAGEWWSSFLLVSNHSNQSIYIDNRPNGYDKIFRDYKTLKYVIGRHKAGRFDILIEKENGEVLEPHNQVSMRSGRHGIVEIVPKKTGEIRIDLQGYRRFSPGKYKLIAIKDLVVYLNKKKRHRRYDFLNYKKVVLCNTKQVSTTLIINEPLKDTPKN